MIYLSIYGKNFSMKMDALTMDGIKTKHFKLALGVIIFSFGVTAGHASNDLQKSADLLKKCLDRNIAKETEAGTSQKDIVMTSCKKEFDALQAKLPDEARAGIENKIRAGVGNQLRETSAD